MAVDRVEKEKRGEGASEYSPIRMKARLGLDATMKVQAPTTMVKPVSPITPEQFHRQTAATPFMNNADQVAGQAMRDREINYGLESTETAQPASSVLDSVMDGVAKNAKGQTKQTIFGNK
jgi:hypothetical protein